MRELALFRSIANVVWVQWQGQMWGRREFYFRNIFFRENYGTAPIDSDVRFLA